MAGADRGRGRRGKGRGEPVLALWYGNKHFAGKGGKEGLRARRVWRSGVGEKIGEKKKKGKMKAKQKRKKSLFFVKSSGQSTPGSQLSKRQPCCLPSERNHGAYLRAVAISLHRHLPVPLWASAVAAPATDLRRQLCASSSLPAILPCLSRVVPFVTTKLHAPFLPCKMEVPRGSAPCSCAAWQLWSCV